MTRRSATHGGDRDAGFTLIELMVTVAMMAIVAVMIGTVLASAQQATNRLQATVAAVDDGRLISAALDRELRSAVCISAPGENLSGNTLTFQSVAFGVTVLLTYVVASGEVTRSADLGSPQTVIEHVGATTTAFRQLKTPLRTVVVDIPIQSDNGGVFHIQTTVAGRNAWQTC